MTVPALFDALPRARAVVPWLPLGCYPARLERLPGLVSDAVDLWVMREDRAGPLYGGNKVRKLEFLLGAARAAGAHRLHTFGGSGAHHVLATAIYGPPAGFAVEATLFPQPVDDHVIDVLRLDVGAGARVHAVRGLAGVVAARWRALRDPGGVWLAGGGSSLCGSLGWVSGGLEVAAQVASGVCPAFDAVYVALGSTGTAAGLLVGLRLGRPVELVAVRVVASPAVGRLATLRLARALARKLEPLGLSGLPAGGARLRVEPGQLGRGYGHATPASREATALAGAAGLPLEPIYTGKVLAALLADAASGRLDGRRVLLIDSASSIDLGPRLASAPALQSLPAPLRALVGAP